MSVDDIDTDYLITLVQERPTLWDKSNKQFKDRIRKANEWTAICETIFDDYEDFDDQKQERICKGIIQKWRSVKDNFFRYVKKSTEEDATGTKKTKKYHYYNQLLFLKKVLEYEKDKSREVEAEGGGESDRNENTSSPLPTAEISLSPVTAGSSGYMSASRKRTYQAIDDYDPQPIDALQKTENRHLSFFKSILPSLNPLTEFQTLTFQSKVINLITELRYGKQTPARPLQSRSYRLQSPSTSGCQTEELGVPYLECDDSREEKYNISLLPDSNP